MEIRIFISRSVGAESPFRKTLEGVGCTVLGESLLGIEPVAFSKVPATDWIFFSSKNGVQQFYAQITTPVSAKIAVIGAGTATALEEFGLQADFIGTGDPATTAAQLEELVEGKSVLFPQAMQSRRSIQQLLKVDCDIENLIVYNSLLRVDFTDPEADILVFTSPRNAAAYFAKIPLKPYQSIVAIGNTTSAVLEKWGFQNVTVAPETSEVGMAEAVISLLEQAM